MSDASPQYVRAEAVLVRKVDSDTLLLRPGQEDVVVLGGSGPMIWTLLQRPRTMSDLVAELARRYDVDPSDIRDDVRRTVDQLADVGLVRGIAA